VSLARTPLTEERSIPRLDAGVAADSADSPAATNVKTVAQGGLVQLAGQGAFRLLNFVFVAVAFRVLGPAAFGLYRQVTQVLQIAGQVASGGFQFAALRTIAQARARRNPGAVRGATRAGLLGSIVISSVVLLGILFGAEALGQLFSDSPAQARDTTHLLLLGAIYVPLVAVTQVLTFATMASRSMKPSVLVNDVIQPGALFVIGVGLLLMGFGVVGLVSGVAASAGVGLLAAIWFWRRSLSPDERHARPTVQAGPMVRFALPQAGVKLLNMRTVAPGILILGVTRSDAEVGLFALAVSLQGIALLFSQAILNTWTATVANLHGRGETAQLQSLYQTINRWSATYSFPILAALIVQPDTFVYFFGGQFIREAAVLTSILAIGTLFSVGTGPCATVVSMTGWPAVNLMNSVGAMALYVGAAIFVVPAHGAVGMAVIDATVTALINICRVVEARVLVGIQPYGASFLKPVIATLCATAVLLMWKLLPGDGVGIGVLGLLAAGACYLLVLWMLGIDPEERLVYERVKGRLLGMLAARRPRAAHP
jgi:O-antigen/teichoic acid export membrane protein